MTRTRDHRTPQPLLIVVLAAVALAAGCRRNVRLEPPITWTWTLAPATAVVGPATLTLTLHEPSGDPLDATIGLEAHMSHPGMAPVLASAIRRAPGTYDIPFAFTMQGDWVLLVSMVLPDGQRIRAAHRRRERPVARLTSAYPRETFS
ncbi:MAG: FixH family protein [Vicinamibacterales bacterium]